MQEAEEQDTCRICSAPAEPDQPLFHPCKCSGTIRYIHQDCLTTWLAHSKKKNCDVCKHSYSFTKVYAPNMPSHLPILLLFRRLLQSAFFGCLYGMRAIVVATIWLAVLPLVTVWTWRMYFSMGDSTALWISDRERPGDAVVNPFYHTVQSSDNTPPPSSLWFLARFHTHPVWHTISADVFSGQIIASLIVLTFVAVFLLREWISQNARPGFFEDDIIPDERPQVQEPRAVPPPVQPPIPVPRIIEDDLGIEDPPPRMRLGHPRHRRAHPRMRTRSLGSLNAETEGEKIRGSGNPAERFKKQSFSRRLHIARAQGARRRLENPSRQDSSEEETVPSPAIVENYAFTFTAQPSSRPRAVSARQTPPRSLTMSSVDPKSSSSIFPPVNLEPPRDAIPFQLDPTSRGSLSPSPGADSSPSSLLPTSLGRLPSPMSTSPSQTPLESPSLSTYRAPEELENGGYFASTLQQPLGDEDDSKFAGSSNAAGPSNLQDAVEADEDSGEEDLDTYFLEPPLASSSAQTNDIEEDAEDVDGDDQVSDDNEDEDDPAERAPAVAPAVLRRFPPPPPVLPRRGQPVVEPPLAAQQNAAVDAAVAAANAAAIAEAQEDLEANAEDDMEGAMEAIGMRGPVYGVVQNATLMIFVLDTAMGLGIWIPYTIGKSTALLTLDPPRLLKILHLPIRFIRILTDPIVDTFVYLLSDFLFPPLMRLAISLLKGITFLCYSFIQATIGSKTAQGASDMSELAYTKAIDISGRSYTLLTGWSFEPPPQNTTSSPTGLEETLQPLVDIAVPFFAGFGGKVRVFATSLHASWISLALGNGAVERIFALVLGYAVAGVMLALYLNILSVGNMKTAGRAVRNVIRQQLLVVKVAMFIFIELVTFPLCCGLVLDGCTVWLFPEASIVSRLAFFFYAPLTAMFYHWIAGTMFMYSFAILLAGCRSVLRPGAMWFIRDPQDQNAHPIRDILDRPTLTQFRKICVSGFMYTVVVLCGVGSIASLLFLGDRSILPFNWKTRAPLSNVPLELLFLHLVLPYSMHYFRPKNASKIMVTQLWKFLAKRLRLTSYYFGGRHHIEEYTLNTWDEVFGFRPPQIKESDIPDGSFRRVPATDNIALPRDMRATAVVASNGLPADDQEKRLIDMQNAEATKANHLPKDDYTVVYIPPNFAWRIVIFIGLLWAIGSILLGIFLAVPVTIGRSFFAVFYSEPVHDGYAFIVGFYLVWACYMIGVAFDNLDRRRQRRPLLSGPRADIRFLALKRSILWSLKVLYMGLFLGVILPTLLGIVMDLYVVLPLRLTLDPHFVRRIRLVDSWALGLLYAKIGVQLAQLRPGNNQVLESLTRIGANGWAHLEPWVATKDLIAPLVGGLCGMILLPAAVFRVLFRLLPMMGLDYQISFLHLYPSIFVLAAACRGTIVGYIMLTKWSQKVRDKEFLVEMRLRNHDPNDNTEPGAQVEDQN